MKFDCEVLNSSFWGEMNYEIVMEPTECTVVINKDKNTVDIHPIDKDRYAPRTISYSDYMHILVMKFIDKFKEYDRHGEVTDTFTSGCCYWFAKILCDRFFDAKLMYDRIENHFCAKIIDNLYDITGDVTGKYDVIDWSQFDDDLESDRIVKQCILFSDGEEFA